MGKRREGDLYFTCGEKDLCSLVPLKLVKTVENLFSRRLLIYYWHSVLKRTHPRIKLHEP